MGASSASAVAAGVVRAIDMVNERIGRVVAWFALAMTLIQAAIVAARYIFAAQTVAFLPALWLQETIVALHGASILLAGGYALLHDAHVRVDVFYREASPRSRAWTDLGGALLALLPACALIWWASWPNVELAVARFEGSNDPRGLPIRWVLKSLVLAFAALLALQAVSSAAKALLRLLGRDAP